MTSEEIFATIAKQQVMGLMVHSDLADYYQFLNLNGYKRLHEYHYLCEVLGNRRLTRYYIDHYNKLIPKFEVSQPKIIPDTWYGNQRRTVDASTKRNAVKSGMEAWAKWERDTKDLYQTLYKELIDAEEIAAARFIECFIDDVDEEVKCTEREKIGLESTGYDIVHIIESQNLIHDKYKKKLEKL